MSSKWTAFGLTVFLLSFDAFGACANAMIARAHPAAEIPGKRNFSERLMHPSSGLGIEIKCLPSYHRQSLRDSFDAMRLSEMVVGILATIRTNRVIYSFHPSRRRLFVATLPTLRCLGPRHRRVSNTAADTPQGRPRRVFPCLLHPLGAGS